jgi:hypothetical protein
MLEVCQQLLDIDDDYMRALEEALEQILGLFDDLIHVNDLVTLGEIDRRHILFVLSQARQALDADYDLNTLGNGDGATQEAQDDK